MNLRRTLASFGSALAASVALAILPGGAQAAGTTTLSAQTAYNCQLFTSPPPPDMYNASVTASIQLSAPSSVYPGETINLSGTLTLQFPESIREVAIVGGFNTVQGVSTTINVGVDAAGTSTDVFADEWQTPPTAVGNPLQVSGVLTIPPLTVPKNATGTYELQMPENGATANTVESTPAKVAFTAVATASGPGGTSPIKVACYLPGSSPELGQIPIVAAPAAATKTTAAKTTAAKSSPVKTTAAKPTAAKTSATKSSSATKATTAKTAGATKSAATPAATATPQAAAATPAPASPSAATAPAAASTKAAKSTQASSSGAAGNAAAAASGASGNTGTAASAGGVSITAGNTGVATPAASSTGTSASGGADAVATPASSTTTTRSGVYVSSSLLVLLGFVVCLASIGYALLANYRLRGIRRELDD